MFSFPWSQNLRVLRFAAILIGKKSDMLDKEEFLRKFNAEADDKTPDGSACAYMQQYA